MSTVQEARAQAQAASTAASVTIRELTEPTDHDSLPT